MHTCTSESRQLRKGAGRRELGGLDAWRQRRKPLIGWVGIDWGEEGEKGVELRCATNGFFWEGKAEEERSGLVKVVDGVGWTGELRRERALRCATENLKINKGLVGRRTSLS